MTIRIELNMWMKCFLSIFQCELSEFSAHVHRSERIMWIWFNKINKSEWKNLDRIDKFLLISYIIIIIIVTIIVFIYVGESTINENLSKFCWKHNQILLPILIPISFLFAIILKIRKIRREKKKTKKLRNKKK